MPAHSRKLSREWKSNARERAADKYEQIADQIEDGSLTIRGRPAAEVQANLEAKAEAARSGRLRKRKGGFYIDTRENI